MGTASEAEVGGDIPTGGNRVTASALPLEFLKDRHPGVFAGMTFCSNT